MDIKVLFTTDFNHSNGSKEIIGIYTNKQKLFKDCKKIITKDITENSDLTHKSEIRDEINYTLGFLFEKNQTQSLNEFELVIEDWEPNKYDL